MEKSEENKSKVMMQIPTLAAVGVIVYVLASSVIP